jgi:hypothetical protein
MPLAINNFLVKGVLRPLPPELQTAALKPLDSVAYRKHLLSNILIGSTVIALLLRHVFFSPLILRHF